MSAKPFQPADHSTVSAYMMASDARQVIDFIADVFDGKTLMRIARDDGSVMHSSIGIGDSVVMIADATKDYPAFPVWLHVYVADVDATYRTALAKGATSVQEPSAKGDGDRRGGFMDPIGNTWWIATPE
ncbi:VOC family protein [Phreatobacter stygius]|uniref:VOC family protein n=1 Tax=Phreatobacter stygius TaxID=1940610 RepID=A0A4D7BEP3_9HYPH|nr:VOC family protein [Phreatobacter stygius]QCI68913.1 VOC family protein [Phreatobacter stygius]